MPNSVAEHIQKLLTYQIKSRFCFTLLLLLSLIYLNMRNLSLERLLCFVLMPYNNLCVEDTKENNMGEG